MARTAPTLHHAQALEQGLPPHLAGQSAALAGRYAPPPGGLRHDQSDFVTVYAQARRLRPRFEAQLKSLERRCGASSALRPGGIKNLERSLIKAESRSMVPIDLLAGKLVMDSLERIYACVPVLEEAFAVVGFVDRFVHPMKSGYRDVQITVALEDEHGGHASRHLAEIKLVHRDFDVLDRHEHRIYEISRELAGERSSFGRIENLFLDELNAMSQTLYAKVWAHIRSRELGSDGAGA